MAIKVFRGTAWRSRCSAEPRGDQGVPRNRVAIKVFRNIKVADDRYDDWLHDDHGD
ncbi:hypothetical protein [Frankia sp. ArI3]|uniref:hypothetical protein n=1 Tax=Frankia sp. ArI3 TaxID=1858 RepID=UPI001C6FC6F7|nr:hypothetical protein [Frankia sp. ArI3]